MNKPLGEMRLYVSDDTGVVCDEQGHDDHDPFGEAFIELPGRRVSVQEVADALAAHWHKYHEGRDYR